MPAHRVSIHSNFNDNQAFHNSMRRLAVLLLLSWSAAAATPPTPLSGAAEMTQLLERLNTLGSALMLAAHPDDENTAVIAYLARGRHMRTAYLSANRGEGGQNLIGTEQGALIGMIRTQELLAARRIDAGEQFFTRVIDFGYSKTPEEAIRLWGRDVLLGDMVRIIRRFRPDVIIARFPPAPGSAGHGQHTAVGHLGPEAFRLAADRTAYPEQIAAGLEPWQAKRYYWNVFQFGRPREGNAADNPDRLTVDTGDYDPVLGKSYAEIAGESRSMHRSQGMGASQRKGAVPALFDYVAGDKAETDLFDGIDTSWARVAGAQEIGDLLGEARERYRPGAPEAILPLLLDAWRRLEAIDDPWAAVKREELARAIELASGLWINATADRWDVTPGSKVAVRIEALRRGPTPVRWSASEVAGLAAGAAAVGLDLRANKVEEREIEISVPLDAAYSQPPWLAKEREGWAYKLDDASLIGRPEAPPPFTAIVRVEIAGVEIPLEKPVSYQWTDRARGERERAVQIAPEVAVSFSRPNLVFPSRAPRRVAVLLKSNSEGVEGAISLAAPEGWRVEPTSIPVGLPRAGQESTVEFEVSPPSSPAGGTLTATFALAGGKTIRTGMLELDYEHIPIQVVFPPAELRVERFDVQLLSKTIGYVMGAGDDIPAALEELGANVTLLSDADLAGGDLARFDAIVAGVRALNTRPGLLAARERVLEYVEAGGTLVMQYNTFSRRNPGAPASDVLGPYPLEPFGYTGDRDDRVTDEDAPMIVLKPDHPLLNAPNKITDSDFEGWVQERGLYFMSEWDPRYEAIWASHDPGQEPQAGGMLYAKYGEGAYVFTGYSWFRQLPAGVPGGYRLFANIVSAGKAKP